MPHHQTGIAKADIATVARHWRGLEGTSDWHVITQDMVDTYAALSGDGEGEWVHLDAERAADELPYGGTIVQGFFQVTHLSKLGAEALRGIEQIDINHALNYGFDRLRFANPMPVGAPFRARLQVTETTRRPAGGLLVKQSVKLELEDGTPTLVADWLFLLGDDAFAATAPAA